MAKFNNIEPGSVERITADQLRTAWAKRNTDRESALNVFRDAVFSYSRAEMMEILDADASEVTKFLTPRLPAEVAARIVPLKPLGPGGANKGTGDPAALDRAVGELRHAGWQQNEIAEGLGVSRQTLVNYNPSGKVVPLSDDEVPEPERIRFYPRRSIPKYIFRGETPVPHSVQDVPREVRERLKALDRAVLEANYKAALESETTDQDLWELVRRAELGLVTYALRVSEDLNISMVSLSLVLRESNRNYLSRMARRHGIEAHVPPSVEKISPVKKTWTRSRLSVREAIDILSKERGRDTREA